MEIMITGKIFDIRKYSINDGPGIRTAVFFKGCPLECHWCHNPEGRNHQQELILHPERCIFCEECVKQCPNEAIMLEADSIQIDRDKCKVRGECVKACYADALQLVSHEMTVRQVLTEIESDAVFYEQSGGGVTFTGGEPLAQPNFLKELLSACRSQGWHTAVDTSGFSSWRIIDEIRPLVSLFLFDLKLFDANRHRKWTGVSNKLILSNLKRLSEMGNKMLIRIPLIPGINDDAENLQQTSGFLTSLVNVPSVELLSYHDSAVTKYAGLGINYKMRGIPKPSLDQIKDHIDLIRSYGLQVK
jgi:pyruvate formate lyase activating enzyme